MTSGGWEKSSQNQIQGRRPEPPASQPPLQPPARGTNTFRSLRDWKNQGRSKLDGARRGRGKYAVIREERKEQQKGEAGGRGVTLSKMKGKAHKGERERYIKSTTVWEEYIKQQKGRDPWLST